MHDDHRLEIAHLSEPSSPKPELHRLGVGPNEANDVELGIGVVCNDSEHVVCGLATSNDHNPGPRKLSCQTPRNGATHHDDAPHTAGCEDHGQSADGSSTGPRAWPVQDLEGDKRR
jgi:hypothetical protein